MLNVKWETAPEGAQFYDPEYEKWYKKEHTGGKQYLMSSTGSKWEYSVYTVINTAWIKRLEEAKFVEEDTNELRSELDAPIPDTFPGWSEAPSQAQWYSPKHHAWIMTGDNKLFHYCFAEEFAADGICDKKISVYTEVQDEWIPRLPMIVDPVVDDTQTSVEGTPLKVSGSMRQEKILTPRHIHNEDRAAAILDAMAVYMVSRMIIPDEWFDELRELNQINV